MNPRHSKSNKMAPKRTMETDAVFQTNTAGIPVHLPQQDTFILHWYKQNIKRKKTSNRSDERGSHASNVNKRTSTFSIKSSCKDQSKTLPQHVPNNKWRHKRCCKGNSFDCNMSEGYYWKLLNRRRPSSSFLNVDFWRFGDKMARVEMSPTRNSLHHMKNASFDC